MLTCNTLSTSWYQVFLKVISVTFINVFRNFNINKFILQNCLKLLNRLVSFFKSNLTGVYRIFNVMLI